MIGIEPKLRMGKQGNISIKDTAMHYSESNAEK